MINYPYVQLLRNDYRVSQVNRKCDIQANFTITAFAIQLPHLQIFALPSLSCLLLNFSYKKNRASFPIALFLGLVSLSLCLNLMALCKCEIVFYI